MNEIGKEMLKRDLLVFKTKEELVEMDMNMLDEIENLQFKIDKAIRIIEEDILNKKIEEVDWDFDDCYFSDMPVERVKPLIDILKGDDK